MELTLTEASFVLRFPDVGVGPTVAQQPVDVVGEFAGDAEDRDGGALVTSCPAIRGA